MFGMASNRAASKLRAALDGDRVDLRHVTELAVVCEMEHGVVAVDQSIPAPTVAIRSSMLALSR